MASIASGEAFFFFFFFFDEVYYALSSKLTSKHYFVAESLFCLQWDVALQDVILNKKKWGINIYDQLIIFMLKSTSMNLGNVFVCFNQLLWYCCSFPLISSIADIIHRYIFLLRKKMAGLNKLFFPLHLRCCEN